MLLPNLIPLIDVTFSTPTLDYAQNSSMSELGHAAEGAEKSDRRG
jgi:hypothetical protein